MRRLVRPLVLGVLAAALSPLAVAAPAAAVTRCGTGLVALTFDDGPSATVTPRLVRLLDDLRVPATFFMVGERVAAAPRVARMVARHGYAVANHSYRHTMMTRQTDAAIRATLAATDRALRNAGVVPTRLMRPPYGAMDARVERVVRGAGYVPVLWDVDPRDWERRSATDIAGRILDRLRPGRNNIVLQHDGIANSPNSVSAVPIVVREARRRGYCFAGLDAAGRVTPPVPVVRVRAGAADEGTAVRAVVRLDRPTSRRTSVLLTTADRSARAGADYRARRLRVEFPVGSTRRVVRVPTLLDGLDERDERFAVRVSDPRGLRLGIRRSRPTIRDVDPPTVVRVADASVVEPTEGGVAVPVVVRLDRPSGRRVRVDLATVARSADASDFVPLRASVVFPAGAVRRTVTVTVLADTVEEGTEHFRVRVTGAVHATVGDGVAVVTVQPPPPPPDEPAEEPPPDGTLEATG